MPSPFADASRYQSQRSPRGVVISFAVHAAGVTALLLMPAAVAVIEKQSRTTATNIPIDPVTPPPADPVEDTADPRETVIETPRPPFDVNRSKPPVETGEVTDDPPLPPVGGTGEGTGAGPAPSPTPTATPSPPPPPVVINATLNQRYASQFQPDFPSDEARMGREGRVKIRVLVAPNGRAIRAERLEATSDSFWRVTERQALSRWRFNPATRDGTAVEGWFTVSVVFRLDEA